MGNVIKELKPEPDDVAIVFAACYEYYEDDGYLTDWEKRFIPGIRIEVQMHIELTRNQIASLYKIYYQRIEQDPEALEEFLYKYRMQDLA